MSPQNDPFPMSSPEAQRLAASVGKSEDGKDNWSSMNTQSAGKGPRREAIEANSSSKGLLGGEQKSRDQGEEEEDIKEDEFFDRPMWESHGTSSERKLARVLRILERIYKRLYGDKLPPEEMIRTLCLASTLFFMIGGYWLLRSLKDPVLSALCGIETIPKAKIVSVFVVLGVVSIYNHLLDSDIPKHRLFYIFGTFYFGAFIVIALLLMHPTIGLKNEKPSPYRLLGWISYCTIESFGSVMVSLFWSFANSNITLETAKASYGIIVATAQVGSIIGPTVARFAETIGVASCYMIGAICMLMLQGTMRFYIATYGVQDRNTSSATTATTKKAKTGILEGLHLFAKHNYVKGIFAISCLFMVEVTIVDFTMKLLAKEFFAEEYPCEVGMDCYNAETGEHGSSAQATAAFASFMGLFGQATNSLSFLFSLFGTSAVIRFLGLRLTLLLFPTLCLCVIIFVRLYPTLYVVFGAMMLLKANSYALNNPTKEILYQPTSSDVRYKAKSWIDIFGARGSKALGSLVTNFFSDSAANLIANGSFVGMGVASFLIWNARFMGKKFDEYIETGYIVGGDDDDQPGNEYTNVEMAASQNDKEETSCAIDEDSELSHEEEGQGSGETDPSKKANVQMV